jgi:hypothetical protein
VSASVPAYRALVVRARSVRGQAAAEYLGVLLIVSVLIATLATTDLGHAITSGLTQLIRDAGEK